MSRHRYTSTVACKDTPGSGQFRECDKRAAKWAGEEHESVVSFAEEAREVAEPESRENDGQALADRVLLRCCQEGERCLQCASDLCLTNAQIVRAEVDEGESGYEYCEDEKNRGDDEDEGVCEYGGGSEGVRASEKLPAGGVNLRARGDVRHRRVYDGVSPPEAEQESPEKRQGELE